MILSEQPLSQLYDGFGGSKRQSEDTLIQTDRSFITGLYDIEEEGPTELELQRSPGSAQPHGQSASLASVNPARGLAIAPASSANMSRPQVNKRQMGRME